MKTLSQIKLTEINDVQLKLQEMNLLLGGESCGCGCHGSSTKLTNGNTNWNYGYSQSSGGNVLCASWDFPIWDDDFNSSI